MQYLVILALSIITFGLYVINVRFFILSIIILYPIVGQMVSLDFPILGQRINVSMAYGSLVFVICFIEVLKQVTFNLNEEMNALTITSILFLSSCFFSITLSDNKFMCFVATVKVATWILLLLIARRHFRRVNDLLWISRVTIISSLIIIVSYIVSRLGIYGTFSKGYEQYGVLIPSGAFYNPVSYAYPLAMSIPIILILFYLKRNSLFSIIQIIVNVLMILLSYVRAAFVVSIIGFMALTYYLSRFHIKRASVYVVLGVVIFTSIFIIFQLLQPVTATNRWMELREQYKEGDYERLGSGRVGLLLNALDFQISKQSIIGNIFGIGFGSSSSITKSKKVVHNAFLEIWLGCGIVGLLLYAIFLWHMWAKLKSIVKGSSDMRIKYLGCLGLMNFFIFFAAHMDVILMAVFPMSLFAIHVGATLGLRENEYRQ